MRLSNTLMMDVKLMPSTKKAFTLAEVLITLSILGVVAALTIPSLVNRQSDLAAQVKLKKAISNYEDVIGTYMAEKERSDARAMFGTSTNGAAATDCTKVKDYFKVVKTGVDDCNFVTADGVAWHIDNATGNAVITDNEKKGAARYAVVMWNANNRVNVNNPTTSDNVSNIFQKPAEGDTPTAFTADNLALYDPSNTESDNASLIDTNRKPVVAPDFLQNIFYCKVDTAYASGSTCPSNQRP